MDCATKSGNLFHLILTLLLLCPLAGSCAKRVRLHDQPPLLKTSFTGYNLYGESRSCYAAEDLSQCSQQARSEQDPEAEAPTDLKSMQENFKQKCLKADYKVFSCDCSSYLCSHAVD
ncbi:MAG: hypothetical protein KA436_11460 [Oligoflexales bacterium]|nr:hypothetical protein [Oligoflexales bacterium]